MPAYFDDYYYSNQRIVSPKLIALNSPPTYKCPALPLHKDVISLSRQPSSADLQSLNKKPSLDTLPPEILTQILQEVVLQQCDGNPSNYYSTTTFFARLLTTCSAFYDVGTPILYRHVAFADPHTFDKFLTSIQVTGYGMLTKTMDFSGFTSVGLGRTAKMNDEIQMLTSKTISMALDLCPNLHEFLASENIEKDMDHRVLTKLFVEMPFLQAIDFCGATDQRFVQALATTAAAMPSSNILRLSLHGCSTVSPGILETLLAKLPRLTRLDLTHTQVTSPALLGMPQTATLSHLSLSKCVRLSSEGTLKFLVLHKATRTLQWLNMLFEVTRPSPISSQDLDTILRYLPALKYLNLHGLPVRRLDSLATMKTLQSLSLGYAPVSLAALQALLPKLPQLKYLDLSGNPNINLWTVQDPALLHANRSIEMFELSTDLLSRMDGVKLPGFSTVVGQGRRGWLVRTPPPATAATTTPDPAPAQRFTFSNFAETRIRNRSMSPTSTSSRSPPRSPTQVHTQTDMMGTPVWTKASRKINVCFVGIGGTATADACKERGIYLYYGYRK